MSSRFSLKPVSLSECLTAQRRIPELATGASLARYERKIAAAPFLALVAYQQHHIIGFKLGFALSPQCFYSWLGGVVPSYRSQGVARALLQYQERWAKAHGYQEIQVKSMLCFSAMRAMLAKYQYLQLTANSQIDADTKIVFSKLL